MKLNRSLLKGLFGQFNPSRGDLVFSRTGELLGVMANSTYCMVLRNFQRAAATFQFRAGRPRPAHRRHPVAPLRLCLPDAAETAIGPQPDHTITFAGFANHFLAR